MNDLRLILLVIGIGIIAVIYIWGTFQTRRQQRQQTIRQGSLFDDTAGLKISSKPETEVDYSSVLAGLNPSLSQSRSGQTEVLSGKTFASDNIGLQQQKTDDMQTEELFSTENSAKKPVAVQSRKVEDCPEQGIVALYVIPRGNEVFSGKDILSAVAQLDLQFGEMEIFHHYGVGEMKMERALFSLANMLEPGSFDMKQIDTFTTRGLVMFLYLPAAIDGQLVFELMLNTAQRLADLLGAELCDENRILISEQKIESMRNTIAGTPTA